MKDQFSLAILCLLFVFNTQVIANEAEYKRYHCKSYAQTAVEQNRKNKEMGCGFTGARWSDDEAGQNKWCLSVRDEITYAEEGTRKDMLEKCSLDQASPENPKNQLKDLPKACLAPNSKPILKIFSLFRYEKEVKSPVEGGYIRHDFNGDKHNDHAYLEFEKRPVFSVDDPKTPKYFREEARLVFCLSNGNKGWQRYPTKLTMDASGDVGFGSYDYQISMKGKYLNIRTDYFEHNAGSSYNNADYEFDTAKQAFKVINSEGEAYPVEYDGQPYPMSTPSAPNLGLYTKK